MPDVETPPPHLRGAALHTWRARRNLGPSEATKKPAPSPAPESTLRSTLAGVGTGLFFALLALGTLSFIAHRKASREAPPTLH